MKIIPLVTFSALASCSLILGLGDVTLGNGVPDAPTGGPSDASTDAAMDAAPDVAVAITCGNGARDPGEVCDDGMTNGKPCDYGNPSCMRCNAACTGMVSPGGPYCGDSTTQTQFNEQCDPGGGLDSMGHPKPVDGASCNLDCTSARCGDGHVNMPAHEVCDNFSGSCGTCISTCAVIVVPVQANGSIRAQAALTNINAGDTLTLNDGFHPPVTFEFVFSGSPLPPHVKISVKTTDSAEDVAVAMQAAIDSQSIVLNIATAIDVAALDTVVLTNTRSTRLGNQPIGRTGEVAATFGFVDMTGGAAGDCATGTGCRSNVDCASASCNTTTHKCQ